MFRTKLAALAISLMMTTPAMAGFIDFESDTIGSVANGFTSNSASGVHFTDTSGSDLQVHTHQAIGTQNLLVFGDDPSKLQIDFDFNISALDLFLATMTPAAQMPAILHGWKFSTMGHRSGLRV